MSEFGSIPPDAYLQQVTEQLAKITRDNSESVAAAAQKIVTELPAMVNAIVAAALGANNPV